MTDTPFTVSTDIDLGGRIEPYLSANNADVSVSRGNVPETLPDNASMAPAYQATRDEFLLEIPNGLRFYVRGGEEIRYDHPDDVTTREVQLFLLGSAWGALCYQRHLLPLHASAVIHGDDVYAFTGNSGAGKSTLSAALSKRGHAFFSDDVLIVDPATLGETSLCYAGQKDLKLWSDALEMTKAAKKSPVRDDEDFDKFYADPEAYSDVSSGKLKELYLLVSASSRTGGDDYVFEPVKGALSAKRLYGAVYRRRFAQDIVGQKTLFQWLAKLIQHVDVYKFDRPIMREQFNEGADLMSERLYDRVKAPVGASEA